MADPISDFFGSIFNGTTGGVPNIYILLGIAGLAIIIYLILTRKPQPKTFKPLDLKKETKRRFKREYKYFGKPLNKPMYDPDNDKPIAYAIGYMKVVEMKEFKRIEPVYTNFGRKSMVKKKMELAEQIYEKPYDKLNELEKKNIVEAAKEELRDEEIKKIPIDDKTKIRRGKKEVTEFEQVAMYMIKFCSNSLLSKTLARIFGYGTDWALFDKGQIDFEYDKVLITANFQMRTPYDVFVFSTAGKKRIEDISFGVDREQQLQAIANQTSKVQFFDTDLGRHIEMKREEAKIEQDKRRRQSESHDMR